MRTSSKSCSQWQIYSCTRSSNNKRNNEKLGVVGFGFNHVIFFHSIKTLFINFVDIYKFAKVFIVIAHMSMLWQTWDLDERLYWNLNSMLQLDSIVVQAQNL
jgi:hypothetical protein